MRSTPSTSTVRRVIAVTLSILFAMTFIAPAAVGNPGGDHGVCGDGLWLKADWTGEPTSWDWETDPAWDGDAPTAPVLTVTSTDDGDPMEVDWTSDTSVRAVSVKASTLYESSPGGTSGTVTGIDKPDSDGMHAISHIVFCFADPTPAPGALTIAKSVVGVHDGSDFEIDYDCDEDPTSYNHFFLGHGESDTLAGIPAGSTCQVWESLSRNAEITYTVDSQPVTPGLNGRISFTVRSGQQHEVVVTNTFELPPPPAPTGSLTVVKEVVGDYDGQDAFDFAGTCQLPQFPAHAQFSLADGDSWTFPQEVPGYLDDSPCEFAESDANGADSITYDLDGTELLPGPDGKVHFPLSSAEDLVLTVTNTFEPPPAPTGSLTVVKEVEGEPDGDPAFSIFIVVDGHGGTPQFTDGHQVTYDGLAPGTPWTVAEVNSGGADQLRYTVNGEAVTPDGNGHLRGTIAEGEDVTVTVINTYVPEPPDVVLEKAWFADADDTVPTAIFRKTDDGWTMVEDGPEGYAPPSDFEQPTGFDATVTHGEQTYSVTETRPDGWQNIACPADTPQPNGLRDDFPYERPDGDDLQLQTLDRLEVAQGIDTIRHVVCNAAIPEALVPSIGLTKTGDVTTVTYAPDDGDEETVTYTYTVTNTGETTLTGLVLVDDVLGTITLAASDLDPGASTTGIATHVVTGDDATAGEIVNIAEVTGTAPDQTAVTATDDATVLVEQVLSEVLTKSAITLDKTALVEPDDDGRKVVVWNAATPDTTEITYRYTITNTGETTVADVTLVDDVLGSITLTDTTLGAGESMTATAVHTVSEIDADAGKVTNMAVATGTDPDGAVVDAEADETVLVAEVQAKVAEKVDPLPVTGTNAMALAVVAALSLGLGALLLRTSARRW